MAVHRACLRCGSPDLAMPSTADGVVAEGGQLMGWVCRRCGHQGPAMEFADRAAAEQYRVEREALTKPGQDPPALPEGVVLPERERERSAWTRGLAALVGFVFLSAATLIFLTAAQVGGQAWLVMGPSGLVALLLGLPFAAMARRR